MNIQTTSDTALAMRNVSVKFGSLAAINDVSLQVESGQRHAVLGANGAGKTTLFNVISGDLAQTSGDVSLFGENLIYVPAHARVARGLRRTYQKTQLFETLSVQENLYLACRGASGARTGFRVTGTNDAFSLSAAELAERVGLDSIREMPVEELAYGQKRQLEIGMALAGAPRLVLFDEPAAGLSSVERQRLMGILQELPRSLTFMIIEHDLDVALRIADVVTIMHNGRKLAEGTPDEIQNNNEVQAIYLGGGHH